MNNTLTICQILESNNRIKTKIETFDGVTIIEIHAEGFSDARILKSILEKNYYQHLKGDWCIVFPESQHIIQHASLETAIGVAQEYIINRDNYIEFTEFD